MQKFSLHTHNGFKGIFDGQMTSEELLSQAEQEKWHTAGISNHLICHHDLGYVPVYPGMYFTDYDRAERIYCEYGNEIRETAAKHRIRTLVGFEVDFFDDVTWRNWFEKFIEKQRPDYLICASHRCKYGGKYINVGQLRRLDIAPEIKIRVMKNYFQNLRHGILSGYFDFAAHLDYGAQNSGLDEQLFEEDILAAIEALSKSRTACEINTKQSDKGVYFPREKYIGELCRRQIPLLISDDAHKAEDMGKGFAEAEALLDSAGCRRRFFL